MVIQSSNTFSNNSNIEVNIKYMCSFKFDLSDQRTSTLITTQLKKKKKPKNILNINLYLARVRTLHSAVVRQI